MSPSSQRAWIEIIRNVDAAAGVTVALLAEGVDRNQLEDLLNGMNTVALLAEGVDRNIDQIPSTLYEMVALLAEGVDRNRWRTAT